MIKVKIYFNNLDGQDVKNHLQHKAKKANNKCHTENRFDCYLNYDDTEEKKLERKANIHRYYGSKDCVVAALESSYLKLSAALVLVFISLLI
jgi:hypothetical protein